MGTVIFRLDIRGFLLTLTPRQQMLAYDLTSGERTKDVAQKHGVTPGAISQFRTRFKKLYDEFFAEHADRVQSIEHRSRVDHGA